MGSRSIRAIWTAVKVPWLFKASFVPMALSATIHAVSFCLLFLFFHRGKFLKLLIMQGITLRRKVGQSNIWAFRVAGVGFLDIGLSLSARGLFLESGYLPLSPNLVEFSGQLDKAHKRGWSRVDSHDFIMKGC